MADLYIGSKSFEWGWFSLASLVLLLRFRSHCRLGESVRVPHLRPLLHACPPQEGLPPFSTEAVLCHSAPEADRLFRRLVTSSALFHSPSLKFTSAFYSSVVISGMIRHATIPSRPRLPLACQPQEGLPAASCDKSFRSHAFGTSSRKPLVFCLFRTLPFSVHNIFPFKLFAFNPFRTLSEKQGGVYQLFPKRNSGYPFHESRITNH